MTLPTVLLTLAFVSTASSEPATSSLAALDPAFMVFRDVNVVDLEHGRILEHRVVRVRDGKIEAIDDDLASDFAQARVIEGRGQTFLMPGLVDMHLHLPPDDGAKVGAGRRALALLLANGVTTVRGMAGHPKQIGLRERVANGDVFGPTLYLTGPPLHYGSVAGVEDAKQMVRSHAEAGFDLVKSHHIIDLAIYDAIQTTAHELGIPVAGHVTNEVGLERAIAAGMQFEHLDGFVPALMKAGYDGDPFGQFPTGAALALVDTTGLPALTARFAKAQLPNTPTLALFEAICDGATPTAELAARAEMKYVPKALLAKWSADREQRVQAGFPAADMGPAFVDLRRQIVRALRDAKAPLLVGSDCPQEFFVEGFATHAELEALVQAGLTPREALLAATAAPAAYFAALPENGSATGIEPDFGSLAPGRRADLLLLAKDPLADVGNARSIAGVMLRGRYFDRAELDRMLEDAKRLAGNS